MKIVPYVGAGAHFLVATGAIDVSPLVTPGLALRYEPSHLGLTVGLDMRMYVTKVEAIPIGAFLTLGARF